MTSKLGASINDKGTRFNRLMVEVMKLQRQKKCIRTAGKSSALRWKTSGSFFSSSELFLFLDQTFLFLDLDCLTSLRSVRQLSDLEKKSLISEKKLRLRIFPAQSSLFPAARNIYY